MCGTFSGTLRGRAVTASSDSDSGSHNLGACCRLMALVGDGEVSVPVPPADCSSSEAQDLDPSRWLGRGLVRQLDGRCFSASFCSWPSMNELDFHRPLLRSTRTS